MPITSSQNQKLKEIRKLRMRRRERDRAGRFVAEGEDLLAAADAAGWEPVERFCAAESGLPGVEVEPALLADASGLASGTRTLAVYEERWAPQALGPLCVYLHGVHDPGNVGTILRSADAFGASCVAIGAGTADPFSPKAVRASMGSLFSVPLARVDGVAGLPGVTVALVPAAARPAGSAHAAGAAPAGASAPLSELSAFLPEGWRKTRTVRGEGVTHTARTVRGGDGAPVNTEPSRAAGVTLMIGSEREGLPSALEAAADVTVHIPIQTHSLNAAMAATVALYEVTRMAPA